MRKKPRWALPFCHVLQSKVIAASVGNCWALQNGSRILLSLHRRLAIPVLRRRPLGARLPESRPEWRRDNFEDSRMCDPFCKAQQFPTDAAISLLQRLPGWPWKWLHSSHYVCSFLSFPDIISVCQEMGEIQFWIIRQSLTPTRVTLEGNFFESRNGNRDVAKKWSWKTAFLHQTVNSTSENKG